MREKNQANLFYPAMDQSGFLLEEPVLTVLKASAEFEEFSTFLEISIEFRNIFVSLLKIGSLNRE